MQPLSCVIAIQDICAKIEENRRKHARAQTQTTHEMHEMHEIRDPHGMLNMLDVSHADTLKSMRSRL
jgi:hypothetical protein